ncbi:MAG: FKBP-type peptidyl-prolyl cis-trans isomerase N-terminal domain-containing protein, partial [Phycisphaerales bacterium]
MAAGRQLRMLLILGAFTAAIPLGLARAADPNDFKTDQDKISYILGTRIASQIMGMLKTQDVQVSMPLFIKGLQEALAGQAPPFTAEEQQKIMGPWEQEQEAKVMAKRDEMTAKQ